MIKRAKIGKGKPWVPAPGKTTILIVMEGGIIQDIIGIPKDTKVVVRDYEIEGCDVGDYLKDRKLFVGPAGDLCTHEVWGDSPAVEADGTRRATKRDIEVTE